MKDRMRFSSDISEISQPAFDQSTISQNMVTRGPPSSNQTNAVGHPIGTVRHPKHFNSKYNIDLRTQINFFNSKEKLKHIKPDRDPGFIESGKSSLGAYLTYKIDKDNNFDPESGFCHRSHRTASMANKLAASKSMMRSSIPSYMFKPPIEPEPQSVSDSVQEDLQTAAAM